MSGHIEDEILDFLEGRLAEPHMNEMRRHLEECEACAADVAWARQLREQVLAQGLRHLAPERVLELADVDGLPATAEEQAHLAQCPDCRDELEWARRQAPAEVALSGVEGDTQAADSGPAPRPPLRLRPRRRWIFAGAGVAAAAVIVVMLMPTGHEPPPVSVPGVQPVPGLPLQEDTGRLARLATIAPLPVRITREAAEDGSFEDVRVRALEAYQDAAYDSAVAGFRAALRMRPNDAETSLYLGSAELLCGQPAAAIPPLQAAARTGDPAILGEALWQLVNAQLLLERGSEALATARELNTRAPRAGLDSLITHIERIAR